VFGAEKHCLHDAQLLVENRHGREKHAAHADSTLSAWRSDFLRPRQQTSTQLAAKTLPNMHLVAQITEVVVVAVHTHQVSDSVGNTHIVTRVAIDADGQMRTAQPHVCPCLTMSLVTTQTDI